MTACAACELRVVTVAALEARLAQRRDEAERMDRLLGAMPYAADMLCLIARMQARELKMPPYTQLISRGTEQPQDERSGREIAEDVIEKLKRTVSADGSV